MMEHKEFEALDIDAKFAALKTMEPKEIFYTIKNACHFTVHDLALRDDFMEWYGPLLIVYKNTELYRAAKEAPIDSELCVRCEGSVHPNDY